MKHRYSSILLACIFLFPVRLLIAGPPPEGMWLPFLLNQLTIHDMQANGFKLTAEDVYSVNQASMKDAVLLFGSGCTGAVISDEGLLITNYHCALGTIQSRSSVENDYLTTGFWAMNKSAELPCPGLTVTFINSIEDVTAQVLSVLPAGVSEIRRSILIDSISRTLATDRIKGTHYGAQVKAFYQGNQFFLILTETFRDVRLAGAPPSAIGDFGGDTDNWEWPRHTGDFSLFRIYADSDNKPAEYSTSNVPFKPKYFFPISLKGVQEGDFTMVYGFPGTTNEYATSYAVELVQNVTDPNRVKIRGKILDTWWEDMLKNDTIRIQYTSKHQSLGNGWKKWQGEIHGLKKGEVIAKKESYESEFSNRIAANADWKQRYQNLLPELKVTYDSLRPLQTLIDYYDEALTKPEIFNYAASFQNLLNSSNTKEFPNEATTRELDKMKTASEKFFKNYSPSTDQKVLTETTDLYGDAVGFDLAPDAYREALKKYKGNSTTFSNELFATSFLDNKNEVMRFLNTYQKSSAKKLAKDPFYKIAIALKAYRESEVYPVYDMLRYKAIILNREYMAAQMEVMKERKFYPDGNLTLRIAYGEVEGYEVRDGVQYEYFTTLAGIMEKRNQDIEDYKIPERLAELYRQKDYGAYSDASGSLRTCFVASNHTTGGNSGSPVIDSLGNLIGINFDRVWEGTMSDLYFNPDQCRNISLDIRYVFFIIDKYAGAGHLLSEMQIAK